MAAVVLMIGVLLILIPLPGTAVVFAVPIPWLGFALFSGGRLNQAVLARSVKCGADGYDTVKSRRKRACVQRGSREAAYVASAGDEMQLERRHGICFASPSCDP